MVCFRTMMMRVTEKKRWYCQLASQPKWPRPTCSTPNQILVYEIWFWIYWIPLLRLRAAKKQFCWKDIVADLVNRHWSLRKKRFACKNPSKITMTMTKWNASCMNKPLNFIKNVKPHSPTKIKDISLKKWSMGEWPCHCVTN